MSGADQSDEERTACEFYGPGVYRAFTVRLGMKGRSQ